MDFFKPENIGSVSLALSFFFGGLAAIWKVLAGKGLDVMEQKQVAHETWPIAAEQNIALQTQRTDDLKELITEVRADVSSYSSVSKSERLVRYRLLHP